MDQRTLNLAAYAASGMSPEQYRATGGFRNVIGDFTANLGNSLAKYARAEKALQEKQNAKIASYMKGLNAEADITSLDASQQRAATEFLVAQKREYAAAAMEITNYDPTDDRYMELISVMNGVNNKVKNFLFISTDKSALATTTMGQTKHLAEKLVLNAGMNAGKPPIKFSAIRFGNILASRGSVVEKFIYQIKANLPLTVTDKRMIRYFMTI